MSFARTKGIYYFNQRVKQEKVIINCKGCGGKKEKHAKGFCKTCYIEEYKKNRNKDYFPF